MGAGTVDGINRLTFSNGEGIHYDDFNVVQNTIRHALDDRLYYSLLNRPIQVGDDTPINGGVVVDPAVGWDAAAHIKNKIFSIGGGGLYAAGVGGDSIPSANDELLWLRPGLLGIYDDTVPPTPGSPPKMRWIQVSADDMNFDFSGHGLGAGILSWRISLKIEEIDSNESRHFRDNTTGALTSQSTPKNSLTRGTITVAHNGLGGGYPAVPAGSLTLAKVEENTAGGGEISSCQTFVHPCGRGGLSTSVSQYGDMTQDPLAGGWTIDPWGRAQYTVNDGAMLMIRSPQFNGDPDARLVAMEINYNLPAAATVKLFGATGSASPGPLLLDLSGELVLDQTDNRTLLYFGEDMEVANTLPPLFGGGGSAAVANGYGAYTLVIDDTTDIATPSETLDIKWYWMA